MYDSGKHTWKNLSVWSLVWWIGVAGGLGSGLAYAASSEAETPAAMDATTMHDPTMEMGEGGDIRETRDPARSPRRNGRSSTGPAACTPPFVRRGRENVRSAR